jgi:hypothetical protein
MRASSDGWSVTVRALVRRVLTERRYGMQPVGIHWISHTVMVTQQHCMRVGSRAYSILRRPPRRARAFRRIACVPEGPRQPYTVDAFASTAVRFLGSRIPAPARDARRRAMGEATAAARARPARALRATAGLRRPTSRRAARIPEFQISGSPDRRPHRVVNSPDRSDFR